MPMPRATLQESWKVVRRWSLRFGSSFNLPCLMRSAVNSAMCTILVVFALVNFVPVMGETGSLRKSAGPFMVFMY